MSCLWSPGAKIVIRTTWIPRQCTCCRYICVSIYQSEIEPSCHVKQMHCEVVNPTDKSWVFQKSWLLFSHCVELLIIILCLSTLMLRIATAQYCYRPLSEGSPIFDLSRQKKIGIFEVSLWRGFYFILCSSHCLFFFCNISLPVIFWSMVNDKLPAHANGSRECFASLSIGAILPGQWTDLVDCWCVRHDRNKKLNFLNVKCIMLLMIYKCFWKKQSIRSSVLVAVLCTI